MAKFRPQRGGYAESLAASITVNSLQELACELSVQYNQAVSVDDISVSRYLRSSRNDDTHLVVLNGKAVGYTDGPLK